MTALRLAQIIIPASATLAALLLMLRDARRFEREICRKTRETKEA